jgi:hypothetical protein
MRKRATKVYFLAARRSKNIENDLPTSEEKTEQKHIVSKQQTS